MKTTKWKDLVREEGREERRKRVKGGKEERGDEKRNEVKKEGIRRGREKKKTGKNIPRIFIPFFINHFLTMKFIEIV